jgi:hypothetical protein
VSWAWYTGGTEPHPDDEALIRLSSATFARVEGIELGATDSGECTIGRFGTAISRSGKFPRLQSWHLSNGLDFVMVTYICARIPTEVEIAEAQQIATALSIANSG